MDFSNTSTVASVLWSSTWNAPAPNLAARVCLVWLMLKLTRCFDVFSLSNPKNVKTNDESYEISVGYACTLPELIRLREKRKHDASLFHSLYNTYTCDRQHDATSGRRCCPVACARRLFAVRCADTPMRMAVVVLPFISMVTEKTKHLQRIVAPYNRGRPKRQRIKVNQLPVKPLNLPTRFTCISYF